MVFLLGGLGIGLHGYLICGQVAFGVVMEIPGPLLYGTVRVEYTFEKVLKSGQDVLFALHGLLLLIHGQTDSCLWSQRARIAHVFCIGTERRNGGNEISGSSYHSRIG